MTDWEIIRIKDDPVARDVERWSIVYSVPAEYSLDGGFTHSLPKNLLNTYAAAYEYDVDDEQQVSDMFDHVLTMPMLTAPMIGRPPQGSLVTRMAAADDVGKTLAQARTSLDGRQTYLRDPEELRAEIKAGIGHMKAGAARLKPAAQVELHASGEFVGMADMSENPKYIVMRDMVSRLRPDLIEVGRKVFREQRVLRSAEQRDKIRSAK